MTTKPTIHLALVDDWELRGNGSGDVRELQFQPMRRLVSIYNRIGIRGSFNAEVMQQLTFRKHPQFNTLADEWDQIVTETFRQGHDIQLHVHPQWHNAEYKDGEWNLSSDWSILNYPPEAARRMLEDAKTYLEQLLTKVDPNYRCLSFRSGAWCIAPSLHMLQLLVELGIVFDMSIVAGVLYNTRNIKLDYTNCEEEFLPYYPVMTDARRVSNKVEPIICVPTNSFYASRRYVLLSHMQKVGGKFKQRVASTASNRGNGGNTEVYGEWAEVSLMRRVYQKGVVPYIRGKHTISDLAQLDYPLLKEMLDSIRKRARQSALTDVPIVLENHTKDLHNFAAIEQFLEEAAGSSDVKFITLRELAMDLKQGKFKIKTRSKH